MMKLTRILICNTTESGPRKMFGSNCQGIWRYMALGVHLTAQSLGFRREAVGHITNSNCHVISVCTC